MNYNTYNAYNYITMYPTTNNMFPDAHYCFENNFVGQDSVNQSRNRFVRIEDKGVKAKPLISTRTKLVRIPNSQGLEHSTKRNMTQSLHTKYKIVRCNTIVKEDPKLHEDYLKNRGHLYKLDHHQKRLKMLPLSTNCLPKLKGKTNITVLKQKKCKLTKLNKTKPRINLSDTRSLTNQVLRNKMRKCNLPCPVYRKFGKCKANEVGKCIRVHNPDQISLCTKFLQGACINSKCLLSHKVSPEKMPTCKYFLEGLCTKEDCVYLHVKISAKAEICKDFLEGYCKKGKECLKRHQFLCPDYDKIGSCPRKRCQYPHGDARLLQ
ncbi:putative metal ion binding protein [Trypoxylus dichotomus]